MEISRLNKNDPKIVVKKSNKNNEIKYFFKN